MPHNTETEVNESHIETWVREALSSAKITDIHTHIYAPEFTKLALWGIDEMLTYHYLVAEMFRWVDISYEAFWSLSKHAQADLVWKTLFCDRLPTSEVCTGVLTTLEMLGLDVSSRDLNHFRKYFRKHTIEEQIDKTFELSGVESVVMTNDPFDSVERKVWMSDTKVDPRFRTALRLDVLLNSWETAVPEMKQMGYQVSTDFNNTTVSETKRFLHDWIERLNALYMAVSLPPDFKFPDASVRSRVLERCVLPVAEEAKIPLALMIGVRRQLNPQLRLAGDAGGRSSVEPVENLCASYPSNKFLVTMISRENQHDLCIAARKFRNLMIFGCWWYINNPSLIDEVTRMRLEMLGSSFIPQHSDARVLEQVIYKWQHSKSILAPILASKYADLAATGWTVTEENIKQDIDALVGGNFWWFLRK